MPFYLKSAAMLLDQHWSYAFSMAKNKAKDAKLQVFSHLLIHHNIYSITVYHLENFTQVLSLKPTKPPPY